MIPFLGSTRQLTDSTGEVTLAKSYAPYGEVTHSAGSGQSIFAYTGEQADVTGLTYLRARYYSPLAGRFMSRDTWDGNYNRPLSLNRWMYVEGNPVNAVDPTGHKPCEEKTDPYCVSDRAMDLKNRGQGIGNAVKLGSLLPVEGLAQLADYAMNLYDNDTRDVMWALTIVIDGFDANSKDAVWWQGLTKYHDYSYWLGLDWLPYDNHSEYNDTNWDNTGNLWVHSRIGDWRTEYWDKTANQAYHFWFPVAVTFFDTRGWAEAANLFHEGPIVYDMKSYDDRTAPPFSGNSIQDWNLSKAGMELGDRLAYDWYVQNRLQQVGCSEGYPGLLNHVYTKPGAWIRANLKQ